MEDQTPRHINTGSQSLPGVRCGRMVSGGGLMSSYPCWVELDGSGEHEGPCAVLEIPKTVTARNEWLAARAQEKSRERDTIVADHTPQPNMLPPGIPVPPSMLDPSSLSHPHDRHQADLDKLATGGFSWANTALAGHQCLVALGLLYSACQREYARGADQVVITREYLERLMPETAKLMFDQFALAPQEKS